MTGHDPISEPLNAWLDDFVQGRSGPPASDREVDEVTTAAGTFHRLAREGERYAAATSPMAKRWEDVMQATTIPATRTNVEPRTSRRAVRFVPGLGDAGHLAAILAVMVLVGAMFAHLSPRHDDPADDLALVPGNDTATPAPDAGWLTPVDPAECTIEPRSLDEIGAIMRDPGEWPARQYLPVSPADPGDAEEAAEVYRTWQACYLAALPYEKRAVETPRYISEIAEYRHLDYANYASFEEWRAANEDLRLAYAPADPSALFRYSNALQPLDDMDPDADFADYWESYSSAVDPIYVRILPDGRLVSLVTTLYAENSKNPVTVYPDGPWIADVIFFAPDPTRDGAWAVDQRLSICVFSCGLLYDQVEEDAWYLWPDSASPATPDASPEKALSDASSSEFDWLAPVTADECVVAPRPVDQVATWLENPPDRNSTAYLAVEPTDADTAASAAQSARTWIACGSNDLAAQRHAMESPPFIFYQRTNSITDPTRYDGFESWHHTVESLREVYLTDDPMSYFAFSPDVTPTADQQQYGGAIGLNLLAQPKHAHALPDGRVALPLTWVYQSGGIPAETIAEETFQAIVLIMVQDDTQGGRWVVDDMLGLCLLGCDEFYTNAAETWWAGYGANSVIPPYCIGTTVRHADALAPAPSESAVANLPLVRPEMISGNADLAGYLLFRDEALVTMEGLADAGVDPGIVWVFSEPVVQVEIEAHLVVAAGAGVRTWLVQGADTVTTPGREWETSLEVPVAGCWQILIRAVPVGGGDPIVARAVIPVVEWRGDAISAPATPVASPEALTSTFDRGWFRESVSMPGRS